MFDSVNLEKELVKIRAKGEDESLGLVNQFKSLFQADWEREMSICDAIGRSDGQQEISLSVNQIDEHRIFTTADIHRLAMKYRLRFLPTKYFQGELPTEALFEVKKIERQLDTRLEGFYMLAPANVFKLGDANIDPLLFAPTTDGRYYLIHKWGKDLAWHRALGAIPFRNPLYLLASILVISGVLALIAPMDFFRPGAAFLGWERLALASWNSIFLAGLVSFLWFVSNRQFSSQAWRSPFFN